MEVLQLLGCEEEEEEKAGIAVWSRVVVKLSTGWEVEGGGLHTQSHSALCWVVRTSTATASSGSLSVCVGQGSHTAPEHQETQRAEAERGAWQLLCPHPACTHARVSVQSL